MFTLGSLFDGIGAFPLAATRVGIAPVWASEILPSAISITKRHFPNMQHLGDITKLNGGKIPPVDIVTGGTPCQNFSFAGNRHGLSGAKSGLFWEYIRIIQEMKAATQNEYPKIAIFENVIGLFSSKSAGGYNGSDFQTVLSAFADAEIPMPRSRKWARSGLVRGDGCNLAWVVKDAQYYGVPQRRRRLFVVVDFTGYGNGSAEILFNDESLSWGTAQGRVEGQGTPLSPESGAGLHDKYLLESGVASTPDTPVSAYGETGYGYWQPGVQTMRAEGENRPSRPSNVIVAAFMPGQSKDARSIA
jgi:DNA (cytosine-5)-methyltransferase 1